MSDSGGAGPVAASDTKAAGRLHDLLGYVEQVVKLDERPATRLADHRLGNGRTYVFHEHEFHSLPGIAHDRIDDDGPVWLAIERLKRSDPPPPPAEVADWVDLHADPDTRPILKEFLLVSLSADERDTLLATAAVRSEDCQPSLISDGMFDIRRRLEDNPQVTATFERYVAEVWLPWTLRERPRRRSIALYQKLFELVQVVELGGPDQAVELVWGIGLSRWVKDACSIDLPLIECLVEIELDELSAGTIRVRPRQARPSINLRPYEVLALDGYPLALDGARRAIAQAEETDGVSPFRRDSFELILRGCQTRLDSEGRYLPDVGAIEPTSQIPDGASHLTVSDRWVLFARRRSENFLLRDIENLKASVEENKDDLPGPARTLVMGPEAQSEAGWSPLSNSLGAELIPTQDPEPESPLGDLFFPKPYNEEQIEIVRRLEKTDGVVVQGPPGTGKTHTISNIICHYLATGRRVLVVSHGEAALSVLRDKLPDQVRDLAISITTSEKEGLKQVEGAVRVLQSVVQGVRPAEQARVIGDLERSVIDMKTRLREVDAQLGEMARAQLSPIEGLGVMPAELAKMVVASRSDCQWFEDRPGQFVSQTGISDDAVRGLRDARRLLGRQLEHLGSVLPSRSDLPTGSELAALHIDLVRASELSARASRTGAVRIRFATTSGVENAERAAAALDILVRAATHLTEFAWLEAFLPAGDTARPQMRVPLELYLQDLDRVLAAHPQFVQRPVLLPPDCDDIPEFGTVVRKLAAGDRVFGLFALKERRIRPAIEAVKVSGRRPEGQGDWEQVRHFLEWRDRVLELRARWAALAAELGLSDGAFDLKRMGALADALRSLLLLAPEALRALETHLPAVADVDDRLWPNLMLMTEVRDALRDAVAAARLSAARDEVARVVGLFPEESGKLGKLARELMNDAIGRADIEAERVEAAWNAVLGRIEDLAAHKSYFDQVAAVTDAIAAAGAPHWAGLLRTELVVEEDDPVLLPDWQRAWDWAAADRLLDELDRRDQLTALAEERLQLDAQVGRQFELLVRERTYYALARSMSGPIRSALMMFATALRRIGKGTGAGAERHRRAARQAMSACYGGVPCWIMPSWRVAEQIPGELGTFDLVIMDEASQSDIREVTALLRGKKVLIVGDDKQVSPTAAFIENAKIDRLERTFLAGQPFRTLLLPGASLYDLAKVMFPDKFVMLREHFRCVEPIIRFSSQFYTEDLIPLRVPSASERLDPPLVDVYVADGRRTGDKINHREAEVIVSEIKRFTDSQSLSRIGDLWRSIGVISLIGAKQAALINRMLLDQLGEEAVVRHRIACGDSATFQGNERDVVFLSMVADPSVRQAQTAMHFEQRFNVAMSRARDRLYLVRSVREEDLNPNDLKAKVIRHFKDPMAGRLQQSDDLEARCDSDFERAILRRLLARGYRVRPQVGAVGYSIDLVVDGTGDRRLAIECDGDRYHGPERWADDMARQRVLERVGWRFWRCWASTFTVDPDGCMADLFATLDRMGIEPQTGPAAAESFTEHRIVGASGAAAIASAIEDEHNEHPAQHVERNGIRVGDRVVVRYLDDNKTFSLTLTRDRNDPTNGWVSVGSPLGTRLIGLHEEDEAEFEVNGGVRRVIVVRAEQSAATAA